MVKKNPKNNPKKKKGFSKIYKYIIIMKDFHNINI